jgi:4-aminobutyrate aminotransferase/(S)-3-amino-2-methylpropionate transaminase
MTSGPHIPQERKLVTAIPGPKSQELIKRRSEAVSAALGMAIPVVVEKAGGGVIVDVDGNSIIDMGAGIAVVNVGNSADRVVKNVQAQVEAFTHTCFMIAPYMGYIEVCEALNRLTPGTHKKKSALFNSGAEAVENAVKIARKFTNRQAVVVFEHGYHGRTNLTMAMTAKNMPYKDGFGPFTPEVYRMPMSYPYRCDSCSGSCQSSVLDTVIHKIEKAASLFLARDSSPVYLSSVKTMAFSLLPMKSKLALRAPARCLLAKMRESFLISSPLLKELRVDSHLLASRAAPMSWIQSI